MSTPNLAIAHIAASQNQKEVTANDAFDALDQAICGLTAISLTGATSPLVLRHHDRTPLGRAAARPHPSRRQLRCRPAEQPKALHGTESVGRARDAQDQRRHRRHGRRRRGPAALCRRHRRGRPLARCQRWGRGTGRSERRRHQHHTTRLGRRPALDRQPVGAVPRAVSTSASSSPTGPMPGRWS